MRRIEDQKQEVHNTSQAAIELDVRTILEQLGIDLANWPADLPPLHK